MLVVIILLGMLLYLIKDTPASKERNANDPVQRTWEVGWGYVIMGVIVLILVFAAIPFMLTGEQTNVGYDSNGNFTMHEPSDPNNPFAGDVDGLPSRFGEWMANDHTIPSRGGGVQQRQPQQQAQAQSTSYWNYNGTGPNGEPFKQLCTNGVCGEWVPQ